MRAFHCQSPDNIIASAKTQYSHPRPITARQSIDHSHIASQRQPAITMPPNRLVRAILILEHLNLTERATIKPSHPR